MDEPGISDIITKMPQNSDDTEMKMMTENFVNKYTDEITQIRLIRNNAENEIEEGNEQRDEFLLKRLALRSHSPSKPGSPSKQTPVYKPRAEEV